MAIHLRQHVQLQEALLLIYVTWKAKQAPSTPISDGHILCQEISGPRSNQHRLCSQEAGTFVAGYFLTPLTPLTIDRCAGGMGSVVLPHLSGMV